MIGDVKGKPKTQRPEAAGKAADRAPAPTSDPPVSQPRSTDGGPDATRRRLAARIGSLTGGEAAPTAAGVALQGALARAGESLTATSRKTAAGAGRAARAAARFTKVWLAPRLASGGRAALAGSRKGVRSAVAGSRTGLLAARAGSRQGLRTGAAFAREQAIPRLKHGARAMRDRLRLAELKKDYRRLLLAIHNVVFDREVEQLLFAPTRPRRRWLASRARAEARPAGGEARPHTPRRVFAWAMRAIPEPVTRFTFVDLGAGRGRTLLLAAGYDFERIVGVEPDPALHNDCEMNIAQFPRSRMVCREVDCLLGNIGRLEVPGEQTVFHIFGAPATDELPRALARITESYTRAPRRLYVICAGTGGAEAVARQPIFETLAPDRLLRLKMRAFSPYPVALFRSIV